MFNDLEKRKLEHTYINPYLGKEEVEYLQGNYKWTAPNILPQPHLKLLFTVNYYQILRDPRARNQLSECSGSSQNV